MREDLRAGAMLRAGLETAYHEVGLIWAVVNTGIQGWFASAPES